MREREKDVYIYVCVGGVTMRIDLVRIDFVRVDVVKGSRIAYAACNMSVKCEGV